MELQGTPTDQGTKDPVNDEVVGIRLNKLKVDKQVGVLQDMANGIALVRLRKDVVDLIEGLFGASKVQEYLSLAEGKVSLTQALEELGVTHESFLRYLRLLGSVSRQP